MGEFIQQIIDLVRELGSAGVFIAGIIEQIIVPIPSPIVPMGGGFFLVEKEAGFLTALKDIFIKVALPFSLGSTLGATFVFFIAYQGAFIIIDRFERFFGFGTKEIEKMKKRFFKGKADELMIFLLMAVPVIPSVLVSAVCGAIRVPPYEYYLFTFLGLLVRGLVLGFLGWWFGEAYFQMAQGVNQLESLVLLILGLLALGGLLLAYQKRDRFLGKD